MKILPTYYDYERTINKICAWIGAFGISLSLATLLSRQTNIWLLLMGVLSFLLCRMTVTEELMWDLADVGEFEKFMKQVGSRPHQHIELTKK